MPRTPLSGQEGLGEADVLSLHQWSPEGLETGLACRVERSAGGWPWFITQQ